MTGARKRQRFRESNTSEGNQVLAEEPRRQGAPRRKVNRVPNFTSRRKTTPPPEAAVTRIPPRRRLKPFTIEDDQETVGFETERPEIFLQQEEEEDEGISVQPVSTVRLKLDILMQFDSSSWISLFLHRLSLPLLLHAAWVILLLSSWR